MLNSIIDGILSTFVYRSLKVVQHKWSREQPWNTFMYCLFLLFILWKLDESKKVWGGEIVQNFDDYTQVSTICNNCLEVSFNVCPSESWCVLSMWISLTSMGMPTYQPIGPIFYYLGYQGETWLTHTSTPWDHMDGGWTWKFKEMFDKQVHIHKNEIHQRWVFKSTPHLDNNMDWVDSYIKLINACGQLLIVSIDMF